MASIVRHHLWLFLQPFYWCFCVQYVNYFMHIIEILFRSLQVILYPLQLLYFQTTTQVHWFWIIKCILHGQTSNYISTITRSLWTDAHFLTEKNVVTLWEWYNNVFLLWNAVFQVKPNPTYTRSMTAVKLRIRESYNL